MARSIYSEKLRSRTNRLKLPIRKKPFKVLLAPGIFLCYRRNAGPGTWSVEAGWLKRFALADDFENANGLSVMSYYQAAARALKLARGSEGDSERPVTVAEAIDAYETDLEARGGAKYNATSVRNHLSPAMSNKVVMLLTETELASWRNDSSPKASSCRLPIGWASRSKLRWGWLPNATSASTTASPGRTA